MGIYEPSEDSYLIQKYVRELALGRVLDMGTGSGIQALTAITNPNAQFVIAADSNPEAVAALEHQIKTKKIRKLQVVHSDLFSHIKGKFNLIIFNPPYLPKDKGIEDQALYGGKKGWEVSESFFQQASQYLFPDGKILFLFSSLTNKKKIEEILSHRLFQFQELEREKISFEELYLYVIEKTALLRELEKKGLQDVIYFTHGKRGDIYTATLDKNQFIKKYIPQTKNNRKVAIKVQRKESSVENSIQNEVKWLQVVNQKWIGPKYLFHDDKYVAYEFVEGILIEEWLKAHEKKEIFSLLKQLLQQCFVLDQLKINKEELHHPFKHIIITAHHYPVMLDFERCSETDKPKNVTQLLEFFCRLEPLLKSKNIIFDKEIVRKMAKEYKENNTQDILEQIIALFYSL
ncbi:MAG TPA: HemK2/MTQ2 family protein methyltransferase [Candidatus Nanoarchaeia archaeon]|nr:HemK2/MTQ2 family protein methyltransferase [Candidatus Nanoarchaeia archaeon]